MSARLLARLAAVCSHAAPHSDATNYTIEFPKGRDASGNPADIPGEHKALILGATMLIEFIFFEKSNDQSG